MLDIYSKVQMSSTNDFPLIILLGKEDLFWDAMILKNLRERGREFESPDSSGVEGTWRPLTEASFSLAGQLLQRHLELPL